MFTWYMNIYIYIYIHDIWIYIYIYIYPLDYIDLWPYGSKIYPRASDVPWIVDWKSWRRSRFRTIRVAPETIWVIAPCLWKNWENHGKTMGKPWENHGKMVIYMDRSTIFHGKIHYFYGDFEELALILWFKSLETGLSDQNGRCSIPVHDKYLKRGYVSLEGYTIFKQTHSCMHVYNRVYIYIYMHMHTYIICKICKWEVV